MTAFRTHLEFLHRTDDCQRLERPDSPSPQVVAAEAMRANGPALEFTPAGGGVGLASGVYGGVDQLERRNRYPWTRLGIGLGVDRDPAYVDVLEELIELGGRVDDRDVTYVPRAASATDRGLRDLELPTPPDEAWPRFTLGLCSIGSDDGSYWGPIHGTVLDGDTVRARVPEALSGQLRRGDAVTIALGVPAAALATTHLLAVTGRLSTPIEARGVGSTVPVVPTAGGVVPGSSEVVLETTVAASQPETRSEKREFWERLVDATTLTLDVRHVFTREEPVVPFTPLGTPLSDDLELTALAIAARLYERVNGYWGVSPVEWVLLPAEGRLGICLVATEVLYPGFEWQLANLLFSLSRCFDTVVVVDAEASPRALGRVLGDLWVKAHPSRDWLFSEPNAPAARMPTYSRDDTGARLYVDATWDPRWKPEFVAPRVSATDSFPPEIRDAVLESWTDLGFEDEPDVA